jgi:hypothetical protein
VKNLDCQAVGANRNCGCARFSELFFINFGFILNFLSGTPGNERSTCNATLDAAVPEAVGILHRLSSSPNSAPIYF